jgi:hypothetical protein
MLRKLQPVTNKIIQNMALIFDITEDIVYQQGFAEGEEKATLALEERIKQEQEKMKNEQEKMKVEVVINMLQFGKLTVAQIADLSNTSEAFVKKVKKSLSALK